MTGGAVTRTPAAPSSPGATSVGAGGEVAWAAACSCWSWWGCWVWWFGTLPELVEPHLRLSPCPAYQLELSEGSTAPTDQGREWIRCRNSLSPFAPPTNFRQISQKCEESRRSWNWPRCHGRVIRRRGCRRTSHWSGRRRRLACRGTLHTLAAGKFTASAYLEWARVRASRASLFSGISPAQILPAHKTRPLLQISASHGPRFHSILKPDCLMPEILYVRGGGGGSARLEREEGEEEERGSILIICHFSKPQQALTTKKYGKKGQSHPSSVILSCWVTAYCHGLPSEKIIICLVRSCLVVSCFGQYVTLMLWSGSGQVVPCQCQINQSFLLLYNHSF